MRVTPAGQSLDEKRCRVILLRQVRVLTACSGQYVDKVVQAALRTETQPSSSQQETGTLHSGANTFSNPSERHISFCFHGSLASIHSTNARKVWIILQHHVFIPRETFLYLTVLTLPEC